jgi:heavy metal sensor kinase
MFKSIRGSLLFWYALILVLVLASFGSALYYHLRKSAFQEVDSRLWAQAQSLAGAAERADDGELEIELPDAYLKPFREADKDAPYYVIWGPGPSKVTPSRPGLDVLAPEKAGPRERHGRREIVVEGRDGLRILVGQRTNKVMEKLHRFLGKMIGAGAGILALAFAGGWFLASRALGPIRRISEAATDISASNLSRRIDVARTESELGRLAATLNGAFDRLEGAFDRQRRFTADASHELRTPLTIFHSNVELALKKDRTPEEYRAALEVCLKASQRMRGIVDGLLTLARADAGEIALRKEPVDLRALLEETASMLRPMAEQAGVTLEVSGGKAGVAGDPDRLREVVTNLLSNAIRYNRPGGRAAATARAEGTEAIIEVSDTGLGIPKKDRPQIFERFYRVDKARSREAGGSGLGLSITRWIVEAHGGTIAFASKEGEGTTFTVRLPGAAAP